YYPMLMLVFGFAPAHLDRDCFLATLRAMTEKRLQAKAGNNYVLAAALKIAINSVFGKSKSISSWLCDPTVTARVCLTGELIILQAVELVAAIEGVEPISV